MFGLSSSVMQMESKYSLHFSTFFSVSISPPWNKLAGGCLGSGIKELDLDPEFEGDGELDRDLELDSDLELDRDLEFDFDRDLESEAENKSARLF